MAVFIRGGISAGCRRDYLAHRRAQWWAFNPPMSGIASAAGIKTQLTPDGQSHVAVSLQASAQARLRGLRCSITPQSRTEGPVISLLQFCHNLAHFYRAGVRGTPLRVNRCHRYQHVASDSAKHPQLKNGSNPTCHERRCGCS